MGWVNQLYKNVSGMHMALGFIHCTATEVSIEMYIYIFTEKV